MKTKIKKIIGWIILVNVIPLFTMLCAYEVAGSLMAYATGWVINLVIVAIVGSWKLLEYLLFDDESKGETKEIKDVTPFAAHEYFQENISGEPLTEEAVIWHLQEFTKLHKNK